MTRAVVYVPADMDADRARRAALAFADAADVTVVSITGDELSAYALLVAGLVDLVLVPDMRMLTRVTTVGPVPVLCRPASPLHRRPRPVGGLSNP